MSVSSGHKKPKEVLKKPTSAGFFYGYDLSKSLTGSITRMNTFSERLVGRAKRLWPIKQDFLQKRTWYITVLD